ncbi:MAG: hypothetical protein CL983_01920 [Euryarchaeota archaeon]|nr:hypothetical protein [Euryarchaeota archaeon]|tara:strand:- start:66 stop:641 length:576 start_codon:yes stop_codon:yes gene_type:complete
MLLLGIAFRINTMHTEMLEQLCLDEIGEIPSEIKLWHLEDGFAEYLVKFENNIALITMSMYDVEEDGVGYLLEQRLYISPQDYIIGSIKSHSINSEQLLLKVRENQEIYFTDNGGDMQELIELLESWVIEINSRKSSDSLRSRFSSLRREKQAIISKFEQLNFDSIKNDMDFLEKKLKNTQEKLAGNNIEE